MKINKDRLIGARVTVYEQYRPGIHKTLDGKLWYFYIAEDPKFTPRDDQTYTVKAIPVED